MMKSAQKMLKNARKCRKMLKNNDPCQEITDYIDQKMLLQCSGELTLNIE